MISRDGGDASLAVQVLQTEAKQSLAIFAATKEEAQLIGATQRDPTHRSQI